MKKIKLLLLTLILTLTCFPTQAFAVGEVDYAYNYDYWSNQLAAPEAFTAEAILRGENLGIGSFRNPSDIFVSESNRVYIVDSGNNRIVVLDEQFELIQVIKTFDNNGKEDSFNQPSGIFVDADEMIYIADTENGRIVHMDGDGSFIRAFGRPESDLISSDYVYRPTKLVLDSAKRIYVIARNINQGIIELDMDGGFQSFMGAIPVTVNPWDYVWKRLSTAEQRAAMVSFVPTEYNNIAIDGSGFLYVTSGTLSETQQIPVRRLNLTGTDILRSQAMNPPIGDLSITYTGEGPQGSSIMSDVATDSDSSTYSVLDRNRGRIFTYDEDGNLLYIYGNMSEQEGHFKSPTAITSFGRDLLVTDGVMNTVTYLKVTPYADTIKSALVAHSKGDYDTAKQLWTDVLQTNSNSEIAYYGLGRTQMRTDDFEEAMASFKLANHRSAYSDAFALNLKDVVRENLLLILFVMLLIVAAIVLVVKYKHLVLRKEIPVLDGLNYGFYLIFHPFDGFYDLKHEKRGNAASATVILVALTIVEIMQRQLTGFVFNFYNPLRLNVFSVVISTLLPYLVWILANWCLTTLMDGKGNMKDIYIATGYALFPQVLIQLALIPLSHVFSQDQQAFYYFFLSVAMVWSYALLFFGMMVTHDYGLGKNIAVTVFTFVGMGLILFIGMLVFDLSAQMIGFVQAIAKEIQFRI